MVRFSTATLPSGEALDKKLGVEGSGVERTEEDGIRSSGMSNDLGVGSGVVDTSTYK